MNQEKYIHSVLKKLKCSRPKKDEIKRELQSDISGAMEAGEAFEDIITRMGAPEALAEEFNDNFSKEELKAYKRKKLLKIVGITAGILLVLLLALFYFLPRSRPLEQSGVYTEEAVIERTQEAVSYFYEKDYVSLREMCTLESMKKALSDETLSEARNMFDEDWGAFVTYGNAYTAEITQMGNSMALIQINATYEHAAVTYTLMFDENLSLCGFYVK